MINLTEQDKYWLSGVISAMGSFRLMKAMKPEKWDRLYYLKYTLQSSSRLGMIQRFAELIDKKPSATKRGLVLYLYEDELHNLMTILWKSGLTNERRKEYFELRREVKQENGE